MKHLLLWVPCVFALAAPFYNFTSPELFGIPFFYWFQLLLVLVSALGIYAADKLFAAERLLAAKGFGRARSDV